MTPADYVQLAQVEAAIAWTAVLIRYAPAIGRLLVGRGEVDDVFRALVGFVAITQIGFTVRWYVFPHTVPMMGAAEVSAWLGLYVLSAVEAWALVGFSIARKRVLA